MLSYTSYFCAASIYHIFCLLFNTKFEFSSDIFQFDYFSIVSKLSYLELKESFLSFSSFPVIGNQAKLGLMGNYIVEILTAHFLNEKIITAVAKTVSVLAHGNISNR